MIEYGTIDTKRLFGLEIAAGHYADWTTFIQILPTSVSNIYHSFPMIFDRAKGSSKNHQAWEGGYKDHITECMNIACQQYRWMNQARFLPFTLEDALVVLFLHDIEKPFKLEGRLYRCKYHNGHCGCKDEESIEATKENRKKFRDELIQSWGVSLTDAQKNALEYVEGVPDSKYTPKERTMGELAAFCHTCDIISARLWWDRGLGVPFGSNRWE
jgi:hypothetical protein